MFPPELWPHMTTFVSSSPRQLLHLTTACTAARRGLEFYSQPLHITRAAELDVRVLKHVASVTVVAIAGRRDVSRAEVLSANRLPPDFEFQYQGAVGDEFNWSYDEDIARRLPHALSALSSLELIEFDDLWHFQLSPDQVSRAILHALEGIANIRLAGGLQNLTLVEMVGYTECMTYRDRDAAEHPHLHFANAMAAGTLATRCFCSTMRKCWPVNSLFELSWASHRFCGSVVDLCEAAMQQGLDLNAPARLFSFYVSKLGTDRLEYSFVPALFLHHIPSNFELASAIYSVKQRDEICWKVDSFEVIEHLSRKGGLVGAALLDAIQSGRMSECLSDHRENNYDEAEIETICRCISALPRVSGS